MYLTNNRGVRAADINGDGRTDLITNLSNFGSFSERPLFSAMLAQPDGTFGKTQSLATVNGNGLLSIGDFNLDGREDFVTASSRQYSEVFLAAPPGLASVQSGDINGDGQLDQEIALTAERVVAVSEQHFYAIESGINAYQVELTVAVDDAALN